MALTMLDKRKIKFSPPLDNVVLQAKKIADSYCDYAADATAGLTVAVLGPMLDAKKMLFAQTIAAAIPSPDFAQFEQALMTAAVTFWLSPPVPFTNGVIMGVVTVAAPLPVTPLAVGTNNVESQLQTYLDLFTKSVVVGLVYPPLPAIVPTPLM